MTDVNGCILALCVCDCLERVSFENRNRVRESAREVERRILPLVPRKVVYAAGEFGGGFLFAGELNRPAPYSVMVEYESAHRFTEFYSHGPSKYRERAGATESSAMEAITADGLRAIRDGRRVVGVHLSTGNCCTCNTPRESIEAWRIAGARIVRQLVRIPPMKQRGAA